MSERTRECPSCALEGPADTGACPYCGYEFPTPPTRITVWTALILIILLVVPLILLIRYLL